MEFRALAAVAAVGNNPLVELPRVVQTFRRSAMLWTGNNPALLSGAIAYFTLLSLAPLLFVALWVAGLVLDVETTRALVFAEIEKVGGSGAARTIDRMIEQAGQLSEHWSALIIGIALLFYAASQVFVRLQDALNAMWGAARPADAAWRTRIWFVVRRRLLSLAMVILAGVLLVASMVAKGIAAAIDSIASPLLPDGVALWGALEIGVSAVIAVILFAVLYRILPEKKIPWAAVWPGAVLAGGLYTLGSTFLGAFLARRSTLTVPGAAGSLIALLLWTYYSAHVFFFGAALTRAYVEARIAGETGPKEGS